MRGIKHAMALPDHRLHRLYALVDLDDLVHGFPSLPHVDSLFADCFGPLPNRHFSDRLIERISNRLGIV